MKLGCCGSLEELQMIEKNGFDFIECPVSEVLPRQDEAAFQKKFTDISDSQLHFYAFNCFIPGDLKVCGPEVDMDKLEDYVETVCGRVETLGGEIIVFGSGGARNVPEDYPREAAWLQIKDFLLMVADKAKKHGLTIVVEPLRRAESNILNTLQETMNMVTDIDRKEILALVDFYHLFQEEEPFQHIKDAGRYLAHVHVADSGRLYPGSGDYDYNTFMEMLAAIDYDYGISIECSWNNKSEESRKGLEFLRKKIVEEAF